MTGNEAFHVHVQGAIADLQLPPQAQLHLCMKSTQKCIAHLAEDMQVQKRSARNPIWFRFESFCFNQKATTMANSITQNSLLRRYRFGSLQLEANALQNKVCSLMDVITMHKCHKSLLHK